MTTNDPKNNLLDFERLSEYDTKVKQRQNASINIHNSSIIAHDDIRELISDLTTRLNAIADSEDIDLDQLSEIVAYIKNNRDLIDEVTTSKVNISDIIDTLTSTAINKPLSAKQGKELKSLIDSLTIVVNDKANSNTLSSHTNNTIMHITSEERTNWNDANSKKHTHSNNSVLDGITSNLITAWNNAVTHISDTVKHITSDERTLWNTVSNKVDKATGKGLSTNDLTNALKSNYDTAYTHSQSTHAPSNAQKNVQSDWNATSGDAFIKNKPTIPTKISQLENDSGYKTTDNNTTYTLTQDQSDGHKIIFTPSTGDPTMIIIPDNNTVYTHPTTSGNKHIPIGGKSGQILEWESDGKAKWVDYKSGGNADTLDGYDSTYFAKSELQDDMLSDIELLKENKLNKNGDSKNNTVSFTSYDSTEQSATWRNVTLLSSGESHSSIISKVSEMFNNIRYMWQTFNTYFYSNAVDHNRMSTDISELNSSLGEKANSDHAHNYAGSSTSGGDANNSLKLSGYSASTAATANTIGMRDANGFFWAKYFNQSSGAESMNTSSYVMYANSDGYLRKGTLASARTALGLGNYLPLTGGVMTGQLTLNTCNLYCNNIRYSDNIFVCSQNSNAAMDSKGAYRFSSDRLLPGVDNTCYLGQTTYRWKQLFAGTSTISTSDRNYKQDIQPLSDIHKELFMRLLPVSYTFIDGTSGRTHIGFVSQDVEDAMLELGLSSLDFAGFCKDLKTKFIQKKVLITDEIGNAILDENGNEQYNLFEDEIPDLDENGNEQYIYSLRYSEFIALNTYMLQNTINDVKNLKEELEKVKDKIK